MEFSPKEYDFFISHASEDKDGFVRPLAEELIKLGFKVWYDEKTLKIGDSLFEEISNGIKKSNFGIVVISNHFFKKEWTKKELNGLINKEIFSSEKVILPIWLNISAKDVYNFSPILADKVSISVTNNELDKVIDKILNTANAEIVNIQMIKEKIDFLINCSDDERKKYMIDTETRVKNLVYFEEAYYNWFCSDDAFGGEEWDDFLAEKKRHELQSAYNLPNNVTYNPEFEPGKDMNLIIKLAKKWILQKSNVTEIYELIFLIDWYHELDLPYILWGYPEESLANAETYDLCFQGPYLINPKRKINGENIEKARLQVYEQYYQTE